MANQEQIKILKQGVIGWNRWREDNPNIEIDLSEANLVMMWLFQANFSEANLRKADLHEANLGAANLNRAKLIEANLASTQLSGADLSYADLSKTFLYGSNLTEANLFGSKFSKAYLGHTIFAFDDLSGVVDIDSAIHKMPSTIGTDTLFLSKGKIPEGFLRGCGLSDLEIEFAKLAAPGLDPEQVTDITYRIHQLYLGDGIQYYSCFISYSSKDQEFAQQIHDDLQDNGVRCWFALEDIKIGDQIRPTIDRQIRLRDKLLVILSENSVKSEWVGDEVEAALEEESASGRLVLFPIRLDDAVMDTRDDWAAKVKRRRHIGDFSNWKDEVSYRKAFERLLRDLKASGDEVRE
ncbi:MAG: toll/interleukin-1 receptor domain-containing protein [Anaerolineales bacterium]|nr:toll/interleukin-1 receptor domain-containing protein [Anaerolineales bacterium]